MAMWKLKMAIWKLKMALWQLQIAIWKFKMAIWKLKREHGGGRKTPQKDTICSIDGFLLFAEEQLKVTTCAGLGGSKTLPKYSWKMCCLHRK